MSEHAAVELSPEATAFADWLAAGQSPPSELDTARIQAEQVHLEAREPEGVTYREVDAGGVLGIWCEPVDANTDYVLLHSHAGGSVLASAPVDRELAGHIATQVNLNRADLSGLPPTLVSRGTYEVLAGEDEEFAARVKDAGIDTATVVVPGGQHSYVYAAGRIPETDAAIAQIGAWVREKAKI